MAVSDEARGLYSQGANPSTGWHGSLLLCGSGDVQIQTLLWLIYAGVLLIVVVTAAALACSGSSRCSPSSAR